AHRASSSLADRFAAAGGLPLGFSTSQVSTVVSHPPEASRRPSAEKARQETEPWCPASRRTSLPVASSHHAMAPPAVPAASSFPSGEYASSAVRSTVGRARNSVPVATSINTRRLAPRETASVLPSGEKARAMPPPG